MKAIPNTEPRAAVYKDKLYSYIASLNTSEVCSKRLYSEAIQCHIECNKKRDTSTYCSTCFTSNSYQWRLKLTSSKRNSKNMKVEKFSNRKNNKLELKCVVCHTVKKYHEQKLKSSE